MGMSLYGRTVPRQGDPRYLRRVSDPSQQAAWCSAIAPLPSRSDERAARFRDSAIQVMSNHHSYGGSTKLHTVG